MAMTPGPDKVDIENDLQLAAMYRAGADAAPPAHLDDAIRAAARREVAAGPRRAGARRWALPVSLAAVLVLSVSAVTMMREQGADRPDSMISPPETPTMTPPREIAQPPVTAAAETTPKRRSVTSPPVTVADAPAAQAGPPVPAQAMSGRVAEAERAVPESRAKAAAAESNRTEAPVAASRDYTVSQPLLRSAPASMAAEMSDGAGASASAKAAAPAPAAALSAVPARGALWQDLLREPPEKWIQRIAELRRTGKTADADTLAAEFRRRFPDQRLPDEAR